MNAKEFVTSFPSTPGPRPPIYPDGTRVRLPVAEGYEDRPQEEGTILSYDWMQGSYSYVVEVDEKFQDGPEDDRLRELDEEQIEGVLKPNG